MQAKLSSLTTINQSYTKLALSDSTHGPSQIQLIYFITMDRMKGVQLKTQTLVQIRTC